MAKDFLKSEEPDVVWAAEHTGAGCATTRIRCIVIKSSSDQQRQAAERGTAMADGRRYTLISSDAHAGASIQGYKPYLASQYHEAFDAWAATFHDPWDDLDAELATQNPNLRVGTSSFLSPVNWESDLRLEHQNSQGIAAEVHLPEHGAAVLPVGRRHRRRTDLRRRLRAALGGDPGPQPLAQGLLRPRARPARRSGPGVPRRRRRRHRRGALGEGGGPRRRPHPVRPHQPRSLNLLRASVRPVLGGVLRARLPGAPPRGRGHAAETAESGPFTNAIGVHETNLLLPARHRPPDPRRRVRALPRPEVRVHRGRDGVHLDAAHAARGRARAGPDPGHQRVPVLPPVRRELEPHPDGVLPAATATSARRC